MFDESSGAMALEDRGRHYTTSVSCLTHVRSISIIDLVLLGPFPLYAGGPMIQLCASGKPGKSPLLG